ncbi:VOC family protein [Crossiella cryophila]|uniref:Putative enzyme related to lactoylglutathione lyase n=1 Tax=Crossiella cryophila TaxID=43355 RepID=A0A7W7CIM5_9PSEU|nr:VOC family protein [Crossiella cryophila]MBB4680448.1 putative enzyme related to lactoylglutathione lyase [Crossiella cryophila]
MELFKPAIINVPVDDVGAGIEFYQTMLGVPLARNLSHAIAYHAPVSSDGVLLVVSQKRFPGEPVTVYFAVESLEESLGRLTDLGGSVIAGPYELSIPKKIRPEFRESFKESPFATEEAGDSLGMGASVHDAQENRFGLIEFNEWAHATFKLGRYARPVTQEQLKDQMIALRRGVPPVELVDD